MEDPNSKYERAREVIRESYCQTFNTDAGQRVLADLMLRCWFGRMKQATVPRWI